MSPSLENFVVLTWLHLLHPDLPRLIKQRYGTELRSRTLASIKPEISQALSSLLDEVHTSEDVKIMRTATTRVDRKNKQFPQRQHTPISRESTSFKVCVLCKAAGRVSNNHFLSQCSYLPAADVDILAGIPFMEINDITVRPAKHQVILGDGTTYAYGSCKDKTTQHTVRRTHVIHAPSISSTVWPGEYIEVNLPDDMIGIDDDFAIEPRLSVNKTDRDHTMWPTPDIVTSVAGKIRIPNLTDQPQVLKRHEHFCQVHSVSVPAETEPFSSQCSSPTPRAQVDTKSKIVHSDFVHLDPDNTFPINVKAKFQDLMFQYDDVFNPKIEGYNGYSGPFQAVVNMGPVQPPQRKGRIPQYSRDKLTELQKKFDDLEEVGVFVRPEDVDVAVEYLNPSFLIKKPNGSFRLVTAFADVGRYSKPQPSLMPVVDSILRQIMDVHYQN